jgi:hypothetical protein
VLHDSAHAVFIIIKINFSTKPTDILSFSTPAAFHLRPIVISAMIRHIFSRVERSFTFGDNSSVPPIFANLYQTDHFLYQPIPNYTKLYQTIPSYTKLYQTIPNYTKLYQTDQTVHPMYIHTLTVNLTLNLSLPMYDTSI